MSRVGTVDVLAPKARGMILDGYDERTGTWSDPEDRGYVVPRFFTALRTGASLESSAAYARVSYTSILRWRDTGRTFLAARNDDDRDEIPVGEKVFIDFVGRMAELLGTFEVELAVLVRNGCKENPQLALTVLGRRFPHWQERKTLDVGVSDQSLVQDRLADLLAADPGLAIAGEEFALRLERAGGVEGDDE